MLKSYHPQRYHTPELLSSRELQLVSQGKSNIRIPVDRMRQVADELSQGERDVLNQVREALTWPTNLSLAYKYYPLYPHRKWWLEALRRAKRWARFVNIRYLLLALHSIKQEKDEERERTMQGVSIDTSYNKEREYQLIQANELNLEARRRAKIAMVAQGGALC